MKADSIRLSGMPFMKFLRRMMLKIGTAPGSTSAHIVSISLVPLTTRYVGIIPPLKNVVIRKYQIKNGWAGNMFLFKYRG